MIRAVPDSALPFDVQAWLAAYDVILKDCETLAVACRNIDPAVKAMHMLLLNASHLISRMGGDEAHSVLANIVLDLQSGHHQLAQCAEQIEYNITDLEMKASTLVLNLSRSSTEIEPEQLLASLQSETADLMILLMQLEQLLSPVKQWSKKANYIAVMGTVDTQQSEEQAAFEAVSARLQLWGKEVDGLVKAAMQAMATLKFGLSQQREELEAAGLKRLEQV